MSGKRPSSSCASSESARAWEGLTCCVELDSGWNISPYSPLKVNRLFRGIHGLHVKGQRTSQVRNQLASRDSSTLKMVTCFSENSVDFQCSALHHVPEDRTLVTTMKISN
jgi:hypothetical protein